MTVAAATPGALVARAVLRAGAPFIGKPGFSYAPATSAETVGTSEIRVALPAIP